MGNPTRVVDIAYEIGREAAHKAKKKLFSAKEVEDQLIEQAISMGQWHPNEMPGKNREQRRLLSRKVRAEMRKRGIKHGTQKRQLGEGTDSGTDAESSGAGAGAEAEAGLQESYDREKDTDS